ncbi:methylosome subunit pICln isoform X3 [Scleropages formosus]|uniref:methylosome subunit pICln isoform X3 n=1 Tax=Scleropages formosus TaxID=113540 RepID=UPI000878FF61|nr:methylosome subunit pICln isoform X3 [Scleropages formosus]
MVLLRSFPPPSAGVRLQQEHTGAVLDGKELGTGTLYVAESRLSWVNSAGMGFSLEYPSIGLHAISRDPSAYPQEHLYVMVNARLKESEMEAEKESEDDGDECDSEEDDDSEAITEIRFVPSDKSALEPMFAAMCDCQALHPDPEDTDSDDDFEGEEHEEEAEEQGQGDVPTFYTYEEGLSHLTPEGQATLERLEGMLASSVTQQFHMAGVRTDDTAADYDDGMEVDPGSTVAGQFEDADVDHW